MKNGATYEDLLTNLRQYKHKYYLNRLLRGTIISTGLISTVFLVLTVTEYFGRFNSTGRLLFLLIFSVIFLYTLISWIVLPIIKLINNDKALSNEEASHQIGSYFPEIQDKLINTLQLQGINCTDNSLIIASIQQKTKELNSFSFERAIDLSENRKYLRYTVPPILLIITLLIIIPSFLTESTNRIIKYDKNFPVPAPFKFHILNNFV